MQAFTLLELTTFTPGMANWFLLGSRGSRGEPRWLRRGHVTTSHRPVSRPAPIMCHPGISCQVYHVYHASDSDRLHLFQQKISEVTYVLSASFHGSA